MSWFNSSGLNATFSSLTESISKATESVQNVIPPEYKEGLAKLTLNTDEMIRERQNFREEAIRKEAAKKLLSNILPWETKDSEREILVEECKDAILELSRNEETFFGPYEMPLLNVQLDDEDDVNEDGNDDGELVEANEDVKDTFEMTNISDLGKDATHPVTKHRHLNPSEESKEKLSKLQPLPPLLDDFDLDSHVGLIQNMLKEDPVLVKMQAALSGGGVRERIFWKNYFFHCAYTRYEAGLSVDEIWSYQVGPSVAADATEEISTASTDNKVSGREEETVVFDEDGGTSSSDGGVNSHAPNAGFQEVETVMAANDTVNTTVDAGGLDSTPSLSEGSPNNGFEMVDAALDEGTGDSELDELEAEIARELED